MSSLAFQYGHGDGHGYIVHCGVLPGRDGQRHIYARTERVVIASERKCGLDGQYGVLSVVSFVVEGRRFRILG